MRCGGVNGVLFRHLRRWFKQPIFDHSGLLTIGYGYFNGTMAESYNSSQQRRGPSDSRPRHQRSHAHR
jgi:hypothetical protein